MQCQRLSLRDLLRADAALNRDQLGRQRVGLSDPDQRLREPQAHERHGLLATTDVQPDVKRLGQQRLHVGHHRLPVGRSWAHTREG